MPRFLRFLLAAYAPLAARHLLVDGPPSWRTARPAATKSPPRIAEFSARIDIGSRLRHPASMSDGRTSLAV